MAKLELFGTAQLPLHRAKCATGSSGRVGI